jgi:hypothetical protein
MSYLNKMGGKIPELVAIVKDLHQFASARQLKFVAEYLPGVLNVAADTVSRVLENFAECRLHDEVFEALLQEFPNLLWDCFATMGNHLLPRYISWGPDPGAEKIDFFSNQIPEGAYGFPPFILIGRTLVKIREEGTMMTLVIPLWTGAWWWPLLMRLLVDLPREIVNLSPPLLSPLGDQVTPRWPLIVCQLSGNRSRRASFRERTLRGCSEHGRQEQRAKELLLSTRAIGRRGAPSVPSSGFTHSMIPALLFSR